MNVSYDRPALPVLDDCDLVVVDGSLGGIEAALALARAGRRVALVEARTYLGREITATLRPWIPAPVGDRTFSLPPLITDCIEASGTPTAGARQADSASPGEAKLGFAEEGTGGEFPLRMNAIKMRLEDRLLEAGVKLLYACRPVGVCVEDGVVRGLVVANKSGRQVITCCVILDASTTAIVAKLAGAEFEEFLPGPVTVARTIEFDDVQGLEGSMLDVPPVLGLAGDRVIVHRGYRGPQHVLLEHEVAVTGSTGSALDLTRREVEVRRRTAALALYLCSSVPAFAKAFPGTSSYEVHGPHSPRMTEAVAPWGESFGNVTVDESLDGCRASSFTGPCACIWCLNDAVRAPADVLARLRTPIGSARAGGALARLINEHWGEAVAAGDAGGRAASGPPTALVARPDRRSMKVREPAQPTPGRVYDECAVTSPPVPVVHTADVLVVGGGSSGAIAAIAAARAGVETTLVDMNPGLGGTGTYGGIDMYWFPRRMGFVSELMDRLDEVHDRLGLPRPQGIMPTWNIEARTWVLTDMAEEAGVVMLLASAVVATIVEGRRVRGGVEQVARGAGGGPCACPLGRAYRRHGFLERACAHRRQEQGKGQDIMTLFREHTIDRIETHVLERHYPRPIGFNARRGPHGQHAKLTARVVLTDQGASGWGICEGPEEAVERFVGRRLSELFDPEVGVVPEAQMLDRALHDLAGKVLGQPVWKMLGAAAGRSVPIYSGAIYFDDLDPSGEAPGLEAILDACRQDALAGHRHFKLKIGRGFRMMDRAVGDKRDVEVTRLVREHFPEARILVDANDGYAAEGACHYLEQVRDCDLYWVEELFPETKSGLEMLRATVEKHSPDTLIADGEARGGRDQDPPGPFGRWQAEHLEELYGLSRAGLLDVLLMDVGGMGFSAWRRVMPRLLDIGVEGSPHAWGEPLKTYYAAQIACGLGNVPIVEGVPGNVDGVDDSGYVLEGGVLTLPDAPGFALDLCL